MSKLLLYYNRGFHMSIVRVGWRKIFVEKYDTRLALDLSKILPWR